MVDRRSCRRPNLPQRDRSPARRVTRCPRRSGARSRVWRGAGDAEAAARRHRVRPLAAAGSGSRGAWARRRRSSPGSPLGSRPNDGGRLQRSRCRAPADAGGFLRSGTSSDAGRWPPRRDQQSPGVHGAGRGTGHRPERRGGLVAVGSILRRGERSCSGRGPDGDLPPPAPRIAPQCGGRCRMEPRTSRRTGVERRGGGA